MGLVKLVQSLHILIVPASAAREAGASLFGTRHMPRYAPKQQHPKTMEWSAWCWNVSGYFEVPNSELPPLTFIIDRKTVTEKLDTSDLCWSNGYIVDLYITKPLASFELWEMQELLMKLITALLHFQVIFFLNKSWFLGWSDNLNMKTHRDQSLKK